ncbi:hypothetical protein ES703_06366 [subsurface metagenome]
MISDATVKMVKYPPERIPDSWFGAVPAAAEVTPAILDLKRFQPYIAILTDVQLTANPLVEARGRYDDVRIVENTAAMLSALIGAWRLPAKNYLSYTLFGNPPGVDPYTTHYSLWAFPPTIAHKLLYGITLTAAEKELAEKLGIFNSVEKGILPLPISQQIEREYHVMGEETHARSIDIAIADTTYTIESIYPRPGEIVVLTRVAANPGGAADIIQLMVSRDNDANYATFPTYPLSLVAGGEVQCFIPATKELRLTTTATVAPADHLFRYTYQRIKLTNILRVRFGLVSPDEVPADLWQKVQAGVL